MGTIFSLFTVSTPFIARATRSIARLLLSQRVRPSVPRRYCIETDKDIIKLFSRPRSPTTMVF